jgi:hypothetical protein
LNSRTKTTTPAEESLETWLQRLDSNGDAAMAWLTHDVFRAGLETGRIRISITSFSVLDLADGAAKWSVVAAGVATLLVPAVLLALWSLEHSAAAIVAAWMLPLAATLGLFRVRRTAPSRWPWLAGAVLSVALILLASGKPLAAPASVLGLGLGWAVAWPWLLDRLSHFAAVKTLEHRADHFNRAIALGKIRIERR